MSMTYGVKPIMEINVPPSFFEEDGLNSITVVFRGVAGEWIHGATEEDWDGFYIQTVDGHNKAIYLPFDSVDLELIKGTYQALMDFEATHPVLLTAVISEGDYFLVSAKIGDLL